VGYCGEGIKVRKNRYIFTILMIISIIATLLLSGCVGKTTTQSTPARKYQIAMVKDITDSKGAKWKIYQLRLTLDGGATFTVDLNLTDGDKVDCWYSTEKPATGGSVDFQIQAGTTLIYASTSASSAAIANTSDRLSFSAVKANGTSYRLIFHSNQADKNSKETVLTEITYPATDSGEDSIFIPLETN
jgi:hypothetical protein